MNKEISICQISPDSKKKIPKVIYMCHKSIKDITIYSKNWKTLNPEYEIRLYDDIHCQKFLREEISPELQEIFNYIPDGPIKADVWRICILYRYGGIYVDADINPLVPLRDFLDENDDFVTCISNVEKPFRKSHLLNPHFIATYRGNPVLKKCIERYIDLYHHNRRYKYWKWSIVRMLQLDFVIVEKKDQILMHEGERYKFILELPSMNDCKYGSKIVFQNRYNFYKDHNFIDENNKK